MSIFRYFGETRLDDKDFIDTYIEQLTNLTEMDLEWARNYNEFSEENEEVRSLLTNMIFSFYATDLAKFHDYMNYIVNKPLDEMNEKELQAHLIALFNQERLEPGSLIIDGVGNKAILDTLIQIRNREYS